MESVMPRQENAISVSSASGGWMPGEGTAALSARLSNQRVIRRTGQLVPFDCSKIAVAVGKAFMAVEQVGSDIEEGLHERVDEVVRRVLEALIRRSAATRFASIAIEDIQDQVELALTRSGNHGVASAYSKYREKHAELRRARISKLLPDAFSVRFPDGMRMVEPGDIYARIEAACQGLDELVDCSLLMQRVVAGLHEGIDEALYDRALVLEASTLIERHPDYSFVAARLLMDALVVETTGERITRAEMAGRYPDHLREMVATGIEADRLDPKLQSKFDLGRLGRELRPERDDMLDYLGMQTLYDRYLIKAGDRRIELPQSMWMRVAMGLAMNESDPTERAAEFYEILSSFRFMSSTPTLFNSGTVFPQLSSCYLSTVSDDLESIFGAIQDNAMLAKFAGGLGNDWTPVRAMGSDIKSTGGKSQGVVPFLRVVNDTAIAVNQGGKRKGAVCCYLETWHKDVKEFLELRKNTGDERRRTHDMNTANWIPDLFIERVRDDGDWVLFSPVDVANPDQPQNLHELYGTEFRKAYESYEARFEAGELPGVKVHAFDLWRSMIGMLYETGHPWITFKDPCNIRSSQQHVGVVHSSNLCTEITLNTSKKEIAVCNLGSVNLGRHMGDDSKLDEDKIARTVKVAMRMLDNVIDINYYSVGKAEHSNKKHRPVGLGQVGFQDCLDKLGVPFDSPEAVEFADLSTELVAYHAYWASSDLAAERGCYESYGGSLWSLGVLPLDSLKLLASERSGGKPAPEPADGWLRTRGLEVNVESRLDWDKLRDKIEKDGMRNSNCLAIAPTATISNIMGASPCIEPTYKNIYVKSNLSGEFKVINASLVHDLVQEGLWDDAMVSEIKDCDGEIEDIERIPEGIRSRYRTVFNIDQSWLVEAASRRQKWIDQSQSLNLFFKDADGRKISDTYMLAWLRGLKTTYYCRSLQGSATEKYTTQSTGQLGQVAIPGRPQACAIDDPDCEACQ